MKNKIYLTALLLSNFAFSQVKDISFTIAPVANYTFWDNQSGLDNGLLYGGKIGFGFGEYIELRAMYLQSHDLKSKFSKYGIAGYDSNTFTPQDLDLTRWGGELKANIGRGRLNPYVTFGTGVQNIAIKNGNDFDQIYTSVGLGIKTKINNRIVLNIEAKNTAFNFNSGKNLLTASDKTNMGVTDASFESQLLYNWSAQASLQFYLGGRKPGTLSELDKAYLQKFRGGFKGIQWVVEPGASYVSFDNRSQFKDSYFLGGYAGLDFNRFTGIRAFFFQATQNEQLSFSFDKMNMYGLEFRARLNDGNGVTPYLILGGGYMSPSNSYVGKSIAVTPEGEKFAQAGLGLNIPLSKNFLITGGVRGMVSSGENVEDLSNPDLLQTHIMYNAGLKLTFGAKSKNPDALYQAEMDDALNKQSKTSAAVLTQQNENNQQKLIDLQSTYQAKLDSLNVALKVANSKNDVDTAVEILETKNKTEKSLEEVEQVTKKAVATPIAIVTKKDSIIIQKANIVIQKDSVTVAKPLVPKVQTATPAKPTKELIRMTPQELEMLIDKILDKTDPTIQQQIKTTTDRAKEMEQMQKRIDFLEKLMLQKNESTVVDPVKK